MKLKVLGIWGVVLLVAALVVGLTGVVLAASVQTWCLNDTTSTAGRVMDRMAGDYTYSVVAVADNSSVIWIADEAAEIDVGFCADNWLTDIYFESAPSGSMTVYIGSSTGAAANFTSAGSTSFTASSVRHQPAISASVFTVSTGDYLAFKLDNNTGSEVKVVTGGFPQSRISGPPCDPGYPVPELSTIIP